MNYVAPPPPSQYINNKDNNSITKSNLCALQIVKLLSNLNYSSQLFQLSANSSTSSTRLSSQLYCPHTNCRMTLSWCNVWHGFYKSSSDFTTFETWLINSRQKRNHNWCRPHSSLSLQHDHAQRDLRLL